MTVFADQAGNLKKQRASEVAGLAALAIAVAALIGWWAGLPLLSSWASGFARTKPMTALCLTALGLALMHRSRDSRFAVAVGCATTAVRCAHSARRRFRYQYLAGAAGCCAGTWPGLVPDDGRDALLFGSHRGRTRAQPRRKVSLRRNPARWPRWHHGGVRPSRLRSRASLSSSARSRHHRCRPSLAISALPPASSCSCWSCSHV
jgi:hypothetical protein